MVKSSKPGFHYQQRTKEDLKERANMKGGNFDTVFKSQFTQWKPKEGKNLIRIFPPTWEGARHYGVDVYINYSIGADNNSYLSLSKHGKGADPLEEAKREALREGDKKLAKDLTPTQRILYWMLDRTDEDAGPLLWAAPFTFDKSLSNLCIDEDTKDVIFIDDPAEGRDVRFYKEGTGLSTKYDSSKMKILPASNIHEDEALENEWLDFIQANPLPEVLNFYDYDHIKAMFDGVAGWQEDDATPVEATPRQRTAPRQSRAADALEPTARTGRSRPVPEEPAPARRTRAVLPPVEPDPDEDALFDVDAPPPASLRDRLARRRAPAVADLDPEDD